jgi:hypothetical protein
LNASERRVCNNSSSPGDFLHHVRYPKALESHRLLVGDLASDPVLLTTYDLLLHVTSDSLFSLGTSRLCRSSRVTLPCQVVWHRLVRSINSYGMEALRLPAIIATGIKKEGPRNKVKVPLSHGVCTATVEVIHRFLLLGDLPTCQHTRSGKPRRIFDSYACTRQHLQLGCDKRALLI